MSSPSLTVTTQPLLALNPSATLKLCLKKFSAVIPVFVSGSGVELAINPLTSAAAVSLLLSHPTSLTIVQAGPPPSSTKRFAQGKTTLTTSYLCVRKNSTGHEISQKNVR
ncbi:hypothetical protein BPAE_0088g00290 [Botrytis paeoniae]|uniref:Uncharacterized protein n=1 Tax=Botrytis paeoniae TaxID=278948 RepID=A0A4Z1FTM1_9HELO|nr:hypothetical protein BPAE_0088g00290 [Botrytis paeoniae]